MATTKKDTTKQPIITQLVFAKPQRQPTDVGKWRSALVSADAGRVKQLFDLFSDLLIDGVLGDAVDKRIDAIKLAPLAFHNADGQEVEEMNTFMDSPAFEELLETIMQAKFWGRSGGEFSFTTDGWNFDAIPPKHIRIENQNIVINDTDDKGIDYTADDHLLILGKPRNFGLLLKAAPYAIWKRGGFGDWAEWLEVFGMPKRVGKYSSSDPQSRKLLEEAFQRAGSAPWMVVPKETDVEQTTEGGGGSSTSYGDFRKACNEEMLITILGQTMTTLDGSSRSQSETHKEVEESKHRTDMRYVQKVLNHVVVPLLEKRGYPVTNGSFIYPDDTEPLTVAEVVQLSTIMDIPTSYIQYKYGIPVPDEGEAIARRQQQPTLSIAPNPDDEDQDDIGEIKNSDKAGFWRTLGSFFVSAPESGATSETHIKLSDESLTDRIIKASTQGTAFYPDLFDFISSNLLTALDARPVRLADLGFTYNYQNDAFRTAQELNVFHFSAAKTIAELQTLNDLYRKSKSFSDFHKQATEKIDVFNKTWQRTEWQSATLISESTANYNRLSKKTDMFPYWKYVAVMDGKTRPEHASLNGLILPANDPLWSQIWPPNGWKCRCYVVPLMRHEVEGINFNTERDKANAYFDTTEWVNAKAQGFGVNRAIVPQVFAENQMYIKKFPTMAKRLLKDLNYQTYKLGSYEANRKAATIAASKYQGTLPDFVSTLKTENGLTFFTDYLGRNIEFKLQQYLNGHKNKLADRVQYVKAAAETLKTPNEVWINGEGSNELNQYVFVKYYTDVAMIVTARIKGANLYEVVSWWPAHENEKKIKTRYRSGLLIKKPAI